MNAHFALGRDQWIQFASDGYFNASPGGADLASAVTASSAYDVDQIAAQYNRPDILLERVGLGTPAIRSALAARVAVTARLRLRHGFEQRPAGHARPRAAGTRSGSIQASQIAMRVSTRDHDA